MNAEFEWKWFFQPRVGRKAFASLITGVLLLAPLLSLAYQSPPPVGLPRSSPLFRGRMMVRPGEELPHAFEKPAETKKPDLTAPETPGLNQEPVKGPVVSPENPDKPTTQTETPPGPAEPAKPPVVETPQSPPAPPPEKPKAPKLSQAKLKSLLPANCQLHVLKGEDVYTCVVSKMDAHVLHLDVYTLNDANQFIKTERLSVPSWYNQAKVTYEDLLGQGTEFILVNFEGNTGTGTLQNILGIWGWHEHAFKPLLIETVSYKMGAVGYYQNLDVNTRFSNKQNKYLTLTMLFDYHKQVPDKKAEHQRWIDTLHWNNEKFSFYTPALEVQKEKKRQSKLYQNIIKARISLLDVKPGSLNVQTLQKSGIMDIFPRD